MNSLIRAPPQPASLSKFDTYTTWPGGVDPTAKLYSVGGKRKASRKGSKTSRKNRKASRKNRRH